MNSSNDSIDLGNEDTVAHAIKGHGLTAESRDDAAGHAFRGSLVDESQTDTDGHGGKFPVKDDAEDSDTEGHGFRGNITDESGDDSEGHRYSGY